MTKSLKRKKKRRRRNKVLPDSSSAELSRSLLPRASGSFFSFCRVRIVAIITSTRIVVFVMLCRRAISKPEVGNYYNIMHDTV